MTVEQYLAFEKDNPARHEYVAGEVYRVSGPRMRHNLITQNIARRLHGPVRARGCRTYVENVLIRVERQCYYYPDVSVICRDPGVEDWIGENPLLLVEVTSRGTRATDHREKLHAYRGIRSLQHYLIVEQRRREVTSHFRTPNGEWDRVEWIESGAIELAALRCILTLDEIYDEVPLPALRIREGMPSGYPFDDDFDDSEDDDELW